MTPSRNDGDYEYDQAHDLQDGEVPGADPHPLGQPSPPAGMPAVEPDGDYSYDQAHDVGGR